MLQDIHPILLLLIVVTGIVSFVGFRDQQFFERFKFQLTRIKNGELFRMLSSGFLHAGEIHLILNIYPILLLLTLLFDDLLVNHSMDQVVDSRCRKYYLG